MRQTSGTLPDGRPIEAVTLESPALRVRLLTLGATLDAVHLAGHARNLTLNHPDAAGYLASRDYRGAVVGPVANRIAGARFTLAGRDCRLAANEGPNTLHGGAAGLHRRLWTLEDHGSDHARLSLGLADGDGGFPGNRRIEARFRLEAAALTLTLSATSDAATVINLANHSYWRLGPAPGIAGHRLAIAAAAYLEIDAAGLPSGRLLACAGEMDFSAPRDLAGAPPLDHCFVAQGRGLREVARLEGPDGIGLGLDSDQPGLQVYDGAALGHAGIALEAQRFPDAPNLWPDQVALAPGEVSRQTTRWRFSG